jgi:hypothetical protein
MESCWHTPVRLPEDGATLAERVVEHAVLDLYFAGRDARTNWRARPSKKREQPVP